MNKINKHYTQINSEAWDKWVEDGIEWGIPITHEEYLAAVKGKWGGGLSHPQEDSSKGVVPGF